MLDFYPENLHFVCFVTWNWLYRFMHLNMMIKSNLYRNEDSCSIQRFSRRILCRVLLQSPGRHLIQSSRSLSLAMIRSEKELQNGHPGSPLFSPRWTSHCDGGAGVQPDDALTGFDAVENDSIYQRYFGPCYLQILFEQSWKWFYLSMNSGPSFIQILLYCLSRLDGRICDWSHQTSAR